MKTYQNLAEYDWIYSGLAKQLFSRGKIDEASDLCQKLLRSNPSNESILKLWVDILYLNCEYDLCEPNIRKLLKISSSNCEYWYMAGMIAYQRFNHYVAIDSFKECLRQCPSHFQAQHHLGVSYRRINLDLRALSHLEVALKLAPDEEWTHFEMGTIKIRQLNYQEANYHLSKTLILNRSNISAYSRLGKLHCLAGKFHRAITILKDGQKINPDNIEIRCELAYLNFKMKKYEDACSLLHPVLDRTQPNRNNPFLYKKAQYLLGRIYFGLKRWEKSEEHFKIALQHDPKFLWPRLELAILYDSLGYTKRKTNQINRIYPVNLYGNDEEYTDLFYYYIYRSKLLKDENKLCTRGGIYFKEKVPIFAKKIMRMIIIQDLDSLSRYFEQLSGETHNCQVFNHLWGVFHRLKGDTDKSIQLLSTALKNGLVNQWVYIDLVLSYIQIQNWGQVSNMLTKIKHMRYRNGIE